LLRRVPFKRREDVDDADRSARRLHCEGQDLAGLGEKAIRIVEIQVCLARYRYGRCLAGEMNVVDDRFLFTGQGEHSVVGDLGVVASIVAIDPAVFEGIPGIGILDYGPAVGRNLERRAPAREDRPVSALQNGPYNSIADYNIAVTAELGHGTPRNYYEAYSEYYYSTLGGSTKYGYIEAWTNLGQMYELGRVPKSSASDARQEATRHYQVAAGHGSPRAEFRIGYLYERGRWTSRNYAMALHWYRFAAAQGDADAEYRLGVMYDQGLGVAKNYSEALRWYRLAWQSQADLFLPAFHSLMQNFAVNTPSSLEGVAQTQPSAGSINAAYSLGAMYEHGNGVPRDYATALHWYQLAAGLGNPDAKAAAERLSRLRSKPPH
jgi:TPR repeat protein